MSLRDSENIALIGLGTSSLAAIDYLLFNPKPGQKIRVSDIKDRKHFQNRLIDRLWKRGIEFQFGEQGIDFIKHSDLILISPGIPPRGSIVEEIIKAQANGDLTGARIATDFDLFCEAIDSDYIAITGTNGKTTTAKLIAHLFETEALGNVGKPVLEFDNAHQNSSKYFSTDSAKAQLKPYVVELSSFQLYYSNIPKAPKTAIYLNFSSDHLDWHRDLDEYKAAKAKICECPETERYIFNYDDAVLRELGDSLGDKVSYFSTREDLSQLDGVHAYLSESELMLSRDKEAIRAARVSDLQLVGEHNYANTLAAILALETFDYGLFGLQSKLADFKAVEHRMEYVADLGSKPSYNDSKATNPESAIQAYEAFDKCIAIVGGKNKNLDLAKLYDVLVERAEHVIIIGELQEEIAAALEARNLANIYLVDSLEAAVATAADIESDLPVIFSPASSSFDMFANYEDRGTQFKRLIQKISANYTRI